MPKQKQPENNLLICDVCQGTGFLGARKCGNCKGRGAGVFAGEHFLYWGGVKNAGDVAVERARRVINKIIDAVLIVFGAFGFGNLIYFSYNQDFRNIADPAWWTLPNCSAFLFFAGILCFLYFAERATRVAHKYEKAMGLSFGQKLEIFSPLTWDDVKKYKSIDISRAMSLGSERTLETALMAAKKKKHSVAADDLFLALLTRSKVKIIFGRLSAAVKTIAEKVARNIADGEERNITLTPQTLQILFNAYIEAARRGSRKVEVNLILLQTVKSSEFLTEVLYDLDIDDKKLANVVKWIEIQDKLYERYVEFKRASLFRGKGSMNRAMTALQTPALDRVSIDLTFLAKRGMIDFCIGREEIF